MHSALPLSLFVYKADFSINVRGEIQWIAFLLLIFCELHERFFPNTQSWLLFVKCIDLHWEIHIQLWCPLSVTVEFLWNYTKLCNVTDVTQVILNKNSAKGIELWTSEAPVMCSSN